MQHGRGPDLAELGVSKIPLVKPWRLSDVVERVRAELSFTILRVAEWTGPESVLRDAGSCGALTVVGTEGAMIRYDAKRSPAHQERQIYHELGHLLCGHHRVSQQQEHPEIATSYVGGINLGTILGTVRRDIFTSPEELAAERLGRELSRGSAGVDHRGRWSLVGSVFGE
nr:ImmA/IrrE family metallo-endopeptidase [Rhodococcus rhodnii]